jgi:membrane associated rhomboid family serine protease
MFMHDSSSIMHILLNMFMLWMFGSIVENTWGGKKFLNFYIITGLGAAVAHYAIVYFQLNPEISFFNRYINAGSPEEMKNLLNNEAINYRYGSEFFEFVRNNNLSATESISYATQFVSQLLNGPVLIGASGAVYGILLAYGMLFPNSLIYIYFMLPLKAKYMVVIYALIELFSGIAGQGNVAHFAHLGGLVTGFILIMYWRNKNRRNNNDFYNPY